MPAVLNMKDYATFQDYTQARGLYGAVTGPYCCQEPAGHKSNEHRDGDKRWLSGRSIHPCPSCRCS